MSNKNPITTAADIADLIEFSINETKPTVKTKRGAGSLIELKVGRRKFLLSVCRPLRRKKAKKSAPVSDKKVLAFKQKSGG